MGVVLCCRTQTDRSWELWGLNTVDTAVQHTRCCFSLMRISFFSHKSRKCLISLMSVLHTTFKRPFLLSRFFPHVYLRTWTCAPSHQLFRGLRPEKMLRSFYSNAICRTFKVMKRELTEYIWDMSIRLKHT